MQENYAFIADAIDTRCQTFTDIADDIWDHPETRFEEFWSAERLASALEAEGFTLTREAGGIPNAFIASYGSGKPVIALLGEYDALAGLSQQAHCATAQSATPGANGHGCGHNLRHGCLCRGGGGEKLAGTARRQRNGAFLRLSRRGRRLR